MTSIAPLAPGSLLVLRTEAGVVYLRLSRLQSLRLRWIFRHFPTLPAQLLSPSLRRMLDRLCQTAVVHPGRPVPGDAVVGVIEEAGVARTSPGGTTHPALALGGSRRSGWPSRWPMVAELAVATACIAVVLSASRALYRERAIPLAHAATSNLLKPIAGLHETPSDSSPYPAPAANTAQPAATAKPAPAAAATNSAPRPAPVAAPAVANPVAADAIPAPLIEPADVETRLVAELPRGHFARPVVAPNSPAGEVQLNVVIAPDGSVQTVQTVSGNRQLAEAGMRAIRQWHYAPYEVQSAAPAVEETRVKMNFFGPDAVSISSVAIRP